FVRLPRPPRPRLFPYTTLFRSALELGPGLVLGGADEVEEARLVALDVAVGALLVQRVQAQERVVVGPLGQSLDVLFGLFEACLQDRKSTRLNSSHVKISYAVFC